MLNTVNNGRRVCHERWHNKESGQQMKMISIDRSKVFFIRSNNFLYLLGPLNSWDDGKISKARNLKLKWIYPYDIVHLKQ